MTTYKIYLGGGRCLTVRAASVLNDGQAYRFLNENEHVVAVIMHDAAFGWVKVDEKASLWKRLVTLLNRKI